MFKFTMLVVIMMAGAVQADPVQKHCLAEAMYFEARNQGWKGMLAVGVVIQNRVKDPRYPDNICSVVRQGKYWQGNPVKHKCQFSYYCDGKHERPAEKQAWKEASDIAGLLVSTDLVVEGLEDATHYHCTTVQPPWTTGLKKRKKVGDHVFYSAR